MSLALAAVTGCNKKPEAAGTAETSPRPALAESKPTRPREKSTGTVKFEVKLDDPTARVVIDGNEYLTRELADPVSLPAGERTVVLKIAGKEVRTRRITVAPGKRQILDVAERPSPTADSRAYAG